MRVSMAELNKKANSIVNLAHSTGETIMIYKHGKPFAEIKPLVNASNNDDALNYLLNVKPVEVENSPESILTEGRQRGL